jgi:hypothetical protein
MQKLPIFTAVAVVITAVSITFAAKNLADANDDAYLLAIHSHKIHATSDEQEVRTAHEICDQLASGESEQQLVKELTPFLEGGMSVNDLTFLIETAEQFYCPGGKGGGIHPGIVV